MRFYLNVTHGAQGTTDHDMLLRVFVFRSVQISIIINHGSRRSMKTWSDDIDFNFSVLITFFVSDLVPYQ